MNIKKLPRVIIIIATITCLIGSSLTALAEADDDAIKVDNYSNKPSHVTMLIMTDINEMKSGYFNYEFSGNGNYFRFSDLWDNLTLVNSDGSKYNFYSVSFGVDPGTYAFSTNSSKKMAVLTPDLQDPGYGTFNANKSDVSKQYESTVDDGGNITLYAIYGDEAFIKQNMSELIKYAKEKSGLAPKEEKEAEIVGTQVINATEKAKSPNFKRIIFIIVGSITVIVLLVLWLKRRSEKRRIWKEYQEELDKKNKENKQDD